jgi:ABC-type nitrate/sulfonate/bicarbonate transport system substrate-binding protein
MSKLDTLWYTRCPVPTPLGIAAQQGWIEEEFRPDGVQVRTLQEVTDPTLRDSHYDHTLDFSFRQGGNIPAVWARSGGRETRVVGLTWTDEAQIILALPSSGIKSVQDLKGKKLGVLVNPQIKIDFWRATTLRAYVAALKAHGLSKDDVTFVDQVRTDAHLGGTTRGWARQDPKASPEVQALLKGEVDAIFHKGSRGIEVAQAIGAQVVYDLVTNPDPNVRVNNGSPRTLTVDKKLLDEHPDYVVRILKRVLQAGKWAHTHQRDALEYVAKETHSTPESVAKAYGNNVGSHLQTDLEESSIAALADFTAFLGEWGFLQGEFDVRAWIDPRPLAQAKRELEAAAKASPQPSASL